MKIKALIAVDENGEEHVINTEAAELSSPIIIFNVEIGDMPIDVAMNHWEKLREAVVRLGLEKFLIALVRHGQGAVSFVGLKEEDKDVK